MRSVKHVEQKSFDGGVSHRGFPGCVDCGFRLRRDHWKTTALQGDPRSADLLRRKDLALRLLREDLRRARGNTLTYLGADDYR